MQIANERSGRYYECGTQQAAKYSLHDINIIFFTDKHFVKILYKPEEIVPAKQFPFSAETLVREVSVAIEAPNAFCMPGAVQNVEQELVQNGFITAGARNYHAACGRR